LDDAITALILPLLRRGGEDELRRVPRCFCFCNPSAPQRCRARPIRCLPETRARPGRERWATPHAPARGSRCLILRGAGPTRWLAGASSRRLSGFSPRRPSSQSGALAIGLLALLLLAIGPALDGAGLAEAAGVPALMAAWAAAVVLIDRWVVGNDS
jgi:hypothetical protein